MHIFSSLNDFSSKHYFPFFIPPLFSNLFVNLMFEMQSTNFKKLFDEETAKLKANSSSVPENNPMIRQFREAVWVYFSLIFIWSFGLDVGL